jgi:outer membrane biosynthesis protein TonB
MMRRSLVSSFATLLAAGMLPFSSSSNAREAASTSQVATAPAKAAETANDVFFESDPQSWARVRRMVEPKYPAAALKEGRGAVVDLEVLIDEIGAVKTVRSLTSTPSSPDFEAAIRNDLAGWLFHVASTDRCVPVETVGNVTVTFQVEQGKGKVSLTHRSLPKPPSDAKVRMGPRIKNRKEVGEDMNQSYPYSARRGGVRAQVYVLLTVDPVTGQVKEIEVPHVITHPDYVQAFAQAAREGMKRAVYTTVEGYTKPWKLCTVAKYELSGREER